MPPPLTEKMSKTSKERPEERLHLRTLTGYRMLAEPSTEAPKAREDISQAFVLGKIVGRGDWILTSDPLVPNQVRYQAALRPDLKFHRRTRTQAPLGQACWPISLTNTQSPN